MILKDPYFLKCGERITEIGRFPVTWALWVVYLFPQLIGLGPNPWKHVGCPHGSGSLLGLLLSLTLNSLVLEHAFWAYVWVCLVPIKFQYFKSAKINV